MENEIELDTVMDEDPDFLLYFSNYSFNTTTPTSDDDAYCNWNICSPLFDFQSFNVGQHDFHDFIDSLIHEDSLASGDPRPNHAAMEEEEEESTGGGCNSFSVKEDDEDGDRKGLSLVHLLMAAVEALTGTNKSHDLARAILVRLKELVSLTNGTNMERLAGYFTDALQIILNGTEGAQNTTKNCVITGSHFEDCQTDMLAAFLLLQDMSPYVKFAHFTANQAILESVAQERRVHIVDYDIMEGAQWASLMQALSTRKDGLPGPHLRITALSRTGTRGTGGRRSIGTIQETGRRLTAFAASVGQPFTFHQCKLDSDETFRPSSLKLVRGEALVFNCMLHLPHQNYRAHHSVTSFLNGAKELSSKLVTLVEEELGPIADEGFVGLFMDSLHRYSALYDSFEAAFPMQRWARSLVERVFLGPQIMGSVAQLYQTGEAYEEKKEWGEWLRAWGFRGVPVSHASYCQAKLLLGLFNDGYRVEELSNNKLVLGWKLRPLFSASIWTCKSEAEFS